MGQEVKNLLRTQSKYGLMGSSAKTGKKISAGHRSSFSIKLSFGIGHPPPIYQMQCICVGGGLKGPKSSNGIQLSRFVQKLLHV